MEKNIYLITCQHIRSEKKQKDYYIIHYTNEQFIPKQDYVDIETYNRIASKMKQNFQKCIAIMKLNDFDRASISDIK